MLFTITINHKSPKIIIGKWVLNNQRVHHEVQVTVSQNNNGHIHVANAPLTIEFESLFLRAIEGPREQDIQFTEAALAELADTIWTAQGFNNEILEALSDLPDTASFIDSLMFSCQRGLHGPPVTRSSSARQTIRSADGKKFLLSQDEQIESQKPF